MKLRAFFYPIAVAFAIWMLVALLTDSGSADTTPTTTTAVPETTTTTVTVDRKLQGLNVTGWRRVALHYRSRVRSLGRALAFDPDTATAINVACIVYGNCATLWRKARCESRLYRYAQNPSGADGVFQFLPSTWRSTPFGRLSVFDPYANALAAGWMHVHGRGGEWVCR